MKVRYNLFLLFLLFFCVLFAGKIVYAADIKAPEMNCAPASSVPAQNSTGVCSESESSVTPTLPDNSILQLLPLIKNPVNKEHSQSAPDKIHGGKSTALSKSTIIYFFRGKGCPHCEEEKKFLDGLKRSQPSLEIRDYEVWYNKENAFLMAAMVRTYGAQPSGVPVTIIGNRVYSGFSKQTGVLLEKAINECIKSSCGDPAEGIVTGTHPKASDPTLPFNSISASTVKKAEEEPSVTIPFFGNFDAKNASLPALTLVIAGMDSFNPCAFFVLLSLLGLLVHAQSRNKMLLIGGIFVFFSGFFYFLFMAAWLNLFLVMGHVALITSIAGWVSVIIAGINIKDFFLFKQGVSLSIPDSAKPKLFERMRKLLRSTSLASIILGATVLAIVANFYELLCTAGFPMVFTRILTLNNLSSTTYYLYLILYNIIYVIPLFIIVVGFSLTLGKRQLSEWQGRVLKLVSGTMMLGLGVILLINPALLNSVQVSFLVLILSLSVSLLIAFVTKKTGRV